MLQPPPVGTPMYASAEDMAIGALTPQWAIWFQEVQQHQLAYQDNAFFEVWSGSFYNDTPSPGHVAWDKVKVKYAGLRYSVAENGSTDKRYIYWEPAYPKKFFSSDDLPFISPGCVIVGENINGAFVTDNISVLRRVHAGLTHDGTVAPGKVIQSSLVDGIVNAAKLADNIISETKLALDLRTIKVVDTLPASGTQDQLVLLSTDGKLYQWQVDKWVPFIRDNDEVTNIANNIVSETKLALNLRTIKTVDILPASGTQDQLVLLSTDGKLYQWQVDQWVPFIRGNDEVSNIAANIVDQTKLALDLRAIKVVTELPASGTSGQVVFLTTDSKLHRWNGAAWTVAVPTSDLSGTITETQIADDSISTPKLKAGSVKTATLDALAVTAEKLAVDSVIAGKIKAGAVGTDELAANSVVASKILAGEVKTASLGALAVTAEKIAANTITAGQISAGAIGTDQLAANSIVASKILAGEVKTASLGALAVTAEKLAVDSVIAGKIKAGAVGTDQLAANSIVASKMVLTDLSQAIPDPGFNDLTWWALHQLGANAWIDSSGYAGRPARLLILHSSLNINKYSSFFEVVPNAHYRLRLHIYKDAGTTGTLGLWIHRPGVQWTSPVTAMNDNGTAINVSGIPDGWSTHEVMRANTGPQRWQFRTAANLSAGYILFAWEVTRASNASLIVDGSIVADKIYAREVVAEKIALEGVLLEHMDDDAVSATTGDPSTYHIAVGALTSFDWQTVDLSDWIPAGYRAAWIKAELWHGSWTTASCGFRRKGYTNAPKTQTLQGSSTGWTAHPWILVECNADREIEVRLTPFTVADPYVEGGRVRLTVMYCHK